MDLTGEMMTLFKKSTLLILILLTLSGLSLPYSLTMAQTADNPFANLEEISLKNSSELQQIAVIDGVQAGYSVSHNDTSVAIAYPDGVRIYKLDELDTPILFFPINNALEVYAPVFSPDGKRLSITFILNGEMKSVTQVWNIEAGKVEQVLSTVYFSLDTDGAQFSPNGRYLMGRDRAYYPDRSADKQPNEASGSLYVWDTDNGEILCEPNECSPRYGIAGFTFTPDSQDVLWGIPDWTASQPLEIYWQLLQLDEIPHNINVMDSLRPYLLERTGPLSGEVGDLAFSPDGNTLVSMSYDSTGKQKATFWNIHNGKLAQTDFTGDWDFIRFFDNQSILVADASKYTVSLVNMNTNESAVLFRNVPKYHWSVSVGNTKKLLATWENNQLIFWGIPKA